MPHLDPAPFEQRAHFSFELKQPQQIGYRRARLADRIGHLLLGQTELVDQALERRRFFNRRKILALNVLYERERHGRFVSYLAHDDRYSIKASELRSSPATLTRDDLVTRTARQFARHDRLHHAVGPNRSRQLLEAVGIHFSSRLIATRTQRADSETDQSLTRRQRFDVSPRRGTRLRLVRDRNPHLASLCRGLAAKQCIEAASESTLARRHEEDSPDQ